MSTKPYVKRPLVYVAGPYTSPYPIYNMRRALQVGTLLAYLGYGSIVPHTSGLWDMITPMPYEVWLKFDLELVLRSDCLLRIPGKSGGADGEVAFANDNGVRVYHTLDDVLAYVPAPDEPLIELGVDGLGPDGIHPLRLVDDVRAIGIEVSENVLARLRAQMKIAA